VRSPGWSDKSPPKAQGPKAQGLERDWLLLDTLDANDGAHHVLSVVGASVTPPVSVAAACLMNGLVTVEIKCDRRTGGGQGELLVGLEAAGGDAQGSRRPR